MMETEWRHDNLVIARKIADHARAKGTTPTAFAVAWLLNNAIVTSPIIGPRTEAQLESYMAALNYRLDAADEAFVNELVVTGHPSTPGYNDPQYPIEGRIALSG